MPVELLWFLGIVLFMAAGATVVLAPWEALLQMGYMLGVLSVEVGVPLEIAYFLSLAWALRTKPDVPKGWYWRSFAHHAQLTPRERLFVLPFFYTGALCFLAATIGILFVILGVIATLF